MKKEKEQPVQEYRFHYHFGDSVGSSDKYFMAHDLDEAKEMFDYACEKRRLHPQVTKVEQWNRWKSSWESIEDPFGDPSRNCLKFRSEGGLPGRAPLHRLVRNPKAFCRG